MKKFGKKLKKIKLKRIIVSPVLLVIRTNTTKKGKNWSPQG